MISKVLCTRERKRVSAKLLMLIAELMLAGYRPGGGLVFMVSDASAAALLLRKRATEIGRIKSWIVNLSFYSLSW